MMVLEREEKGAGKGMRSLKTEVCSKEGRNHVVTQSRGKRIPSRGVGQLLNVSLLEFRTLLKCDQD